MTWPPVARRHRCIRQALAVERNAFLVGDIPEEELARVSAVIDAVMQKAQLLLEQERALSAGEAGEEL